MLTRKVHYLLFALACLLLAGLALSAKAIADDISAVADRAIEAESHSLVTKVQT